MALPAVAHDADVAQDGNGFDPSTTDGVSAFIAAEGGPAARVRGNPPLQELDGG